MLSLCESIQARVGWKIKVKSNFLHKNVLAERGFDPRTSGLWAQHASAAPLCSIVRFHFKDNNPIKRTDL